MCFIDYSKAFDCVDHNRLWGIMTDFGIPTHLVVLLQRLYHNQEATVRTEQGNTEWFGIGKGARQGCVLSPYLFNLYAERIMRDALDNRAGGVSLGGRKINNLRYADDTTLVADTEEGLKELIRSVSAESEKQGLTLNIKKTKVMSTAPLTCFQLDGREVEVVNTFVFLGACIHCDATCDKEIKRRVTLGRKAMMGLQPVMKDRDIPLSLKRRLVYAMVFPVMMYGCESWVMKKADMRRIEAFEMWCWRRMMRVKWTDRVSNSLIKIWADPKAPLLSMVVKQALSYFGHVMRADGMEKDVMLGKVEGSRRRGKPRMRWMDMITREAGKNLKELKEMVKNRRGWRQYVLRVTRDRD